ncbi:hypothetical protein ROTO_14260 [Roseovarius tolerans]|uniref:Chemotaxis protein CheA n=1 Tax=Roseovarius tolerans TaxID=74031 RepID=A0A0L6CWY0_9RHOB|nr:hypothetical protein [Roseovarius tolerans]KNX41958.1 hypothetical protein ROTO_14260 [Roseovarius tolerans]
MVGSSKILTVSYGTFSCTLEGFDDSFDTMKAIAEYFRDLASDDRYFGAEPPTPDAEMLARIAEREISRRVEAHEHQGRIVLRANERQATSQPATEPQQPAAEATQQATAEDAPRQETAARTALAAPLADPVAEPPRAETPLAEDMAADTAPEAPTEQSTPAVATPEPEAVVEPEHEPEAIAEPELEPEAAAEMEPEAVAEPEIEASSDPETPAHVAEELRTPLAADPDSFAAKLHMIRSVVSGDAPSADDQYSEDEHAQDFVQPETDDTAFWPDTYEEDATAEVSPELDDLVEDAAPEPAERDSFEDTLAALMSDAPAEPQAPVTAEVLQDETAEDLPEEIAEAAPEPLAEDDTPLAAQEAEDALEATAEPMEETAPAAQAPVASVMKVKRAELEEAIDQGLFEEDDDEAEADNTDNLFDETEAALSPEDEAELQRELAEVEAEMTPDATAEDVPDNAEDIAEDEPTPAAEAVAPEADPEIEDPAKETGAGRRKLARAEAGNDLSRIFDETDTQLEAPASSQRRNTIQHLRAALAATRAEKQAGSELKRDVDDTPYRTDLADVVRPRRPQAVTSEARSSRPTESRPAPLKLVAEQRVDTPRDPVRPRRISAADVHAKIDTDTDGGFVAYADEMGASALPDLLEAAAAYLADVEGRPQFSRPMLMGKLKEIEKDNFSREDGLRSFGRLLREGKLQKLSGGRFAVTEETEFRAQDKRQAG